MNTNATSQCIFKLHLNLYRDAFCLLVTERNKLSSVSLTDPREDILGLMQRSDLLPVESIQQIKLGGIEGGFGGKDTEKPLVQLLL